MGQPARFKAGDLCALVDCSNDPEFEGLQCTIIKVIGWDVRKDNKRMAFWYQIELQAPPAPNYSIRHHAVQECLRKIYDGNEKSSWDTGIWNPLRGKQDEKRTPYSDHSVLVSTDSTGGRTGDQNGLCRNRLLHSRTDFRTA